MCGFLCVCVCLSVCVFVCPADVPPSPGELYGYFPWARWAKGGGMCGFLCVSVCVCVCVFVRRMSPPLRVLGGSGADVCGVVGWEFGVGMGGPEVVCGAVWCFFVWRFWGEVWGRCVGWLGGRLAEVWGSQGEVCGAVC